MSWVTKVRHGDFDAIPEGLPFDRGGRTLAFLIDALAITGSLEKCQAIHARVLEEVERCGESTASALDQWLALHHAARAQFGMPSSLYSRERTILTILGWSLRSALVSLKPHAKIGIMALIDTPKLDPTGNCNLAELAINCVRPHKK